MSEGVPLIDIRPDHWEIVRDILKKHVPQYAVWAFGSRAKWNAKPYSDLDLAIIADKPLSLAVSAALADDFSESDLPWKVDVVDWATTSASFREIIERDKVVVQEGSESVGMAGGWRLSNWGDEVTLEYGKAIRGYSATHGKYRVFGSNGPIGWTSEALTQGPGVILGRKGAYRGVEYWREPFWVIDTAYYLVPKTELDMRWLYYAVKHYKLGEVDDGSPIPSTTRTAVYMLELDVPPKPEQRAIAHILGTLDDKIELNRRRNQTLEAMARALFKDWFVDFGPVRAKIEGREPYLPADLWQLFPDRLDDKGKAEGWEMQPLSELLTIIGGGTPKTSVEDYWGGDIPWFSVVDTPTVSDVFVVTTEKTITPQGLAGSSARLIPKGTTIISARGTVGNLAIAGREMTFNQSCYGLRGTGSAGDYFVYLTAQQMVDQLKSMAHGSVFSTITRQTFEAIQRPVPPPALLTAFEGLVTGWFDAIQSSVEESRTLAQLRDTLLPKLISGELRVPGATRMAREVA